MPKRHPDEILDTALAKAISEIRKNGGKEFLKSLNNEELQWIRIIVRNAPNQKAVLSVLITSLVKKIETPSQDVRLHQSKMEGGYSGRTLDTETVTPFMHKHFQKYSMKESGWLTRSLEQPHPFTLDFPGEIRNKEVKNAFLQILHSIEEQQGDPEKYLIALFIHLELERRRIQTQLMKIPKVSNEYPIETVVDLLKKHFNGDYHSYGASKLPVLAIYSLYQIMVNELARFKLKKLLPLKSHVTADVKAKSLGDVEVVDETGDFFEVVEIKLGKPINYDMIKTIYDEKIKSTKISRYYVLTSAEPFLVEKEKDDIAELVSRIHEEHGCEIIINGLIPSIRYYLRLIKSTKDFFNKYNENLKLELRTSSEIKEEHIQAWMQLLRTLD